MTPDPVRIRFRQDDLNQIERLAAEHDVTPSTIIRIAYRHFDTHATRLQIRTLIRSNKEEWGR